MTKLIILVLALGLVALVLVKEPRLDYTKEKRLLLWYNDGDYERKYIQIW